MTYETILDSMDVRGIHDWDRFVDALQSDSARDIEVKFDILCELIKSKVRMDSIQSLDEWK